MSQEPVKESNSVTDKTASLVGITDNEDIQKDVCFLCELGKVFHSFETSTHLFSVRNQIEAANQNVWYGRVGLTFFHWIKA